MLYISKHISIPLTEIELRFIRSQGPGGQNINKVSSSVHLRFNINDSSLPSQYQKRLLNLKDQRITKDGIIVIKSQQHRSQIKNKQAALKRLQALIRSVLSVPKKRRPSLPTKTSRLKRLNRKIKRGQLKLLRRKVIE